MACYMILPHQTHLGAPLATSKLQMCMYIYIQYMIYVICLYDFMWSRHLLKPPHLLKDTIGSSSGLGASKASGLVGPAAVGADTMGPMGASTVGAAADTILLGGTGSRGSRSRGKGLVAPRLTCRTKSSAGKGPRPPSWYTAGASATTSVTAFAIWKVLGILAGGAPAPTPGDSSRARGARRPERSKWKMSPGLGGFVVQTFTASKQ